VTKRVTTCTIHKDGRSCTVTYTYAGKASVKSWPVIAVANVNGHEVTLGSGHLAGRYLALRLANVTRRSYRITLIKVQDINHQIILSPIWHTTITVN
jgi:hypothetical protein